ncbi:hypothetical protein O0555_14525 [Brevibacillus laterosporus]|uniref:hypothetical protein n=1 Tax=Brevibacillus laterosporus TaxID=1465 RepID=UPI000CE41D0D|nr:hypothetical protein [Brevibacillus laterosporus]MCR8938545.1 hypothetical protein [Brevibacillus laterosporus]MCZ0841185.1 hypothetical protein [Brevibacillus laterosporus]MCZ0845133.1 hypothetical protein [Brevibacillus laterosporus]MED1911756.1 hypothetical protein [Brevibacillus laterosporus]PPA82737.1 hypothetical protein C4A75_18210 [Brevibacillus laterosporus]
MSTLLLFLFLGLVVVDTEIILQKKQEIKSLIELGNHNASFAIHEELKSEGIIDLIEKEAFIRFSDSMKKNGNYVVRQVELQPGESSITSQPLAMYTLYIDFEQWYRNHKIDLQYRDKKLFAKNIVVSPEKEVTGGKLNITVFDQEAKPKTLAPKKMIGPSRIVVVYASEPSILPFQQPHEFPVISVEELKW